MNTYYANAKINIGLDVTGTRADGYHLLDTVMQEISLADRLEFARTESGIGIECADSAVPLNEDNLISRAIRLLGVDGVYVNLEKNIPMQAGLGGGSSDAAATLKAINEIFSLGKSNAELKAFAVRLGADVPFFIEGGSARCRGIGDEIEPLKDFKDGPLLKKRVIMICKPPANASTQSIYQKYDTLDQSKIVHPDIGRLIEGDTGQVINVLENVTGPENPGIAETEELMKAAGAITACMTGSGTAVFGIFEDSVFDDAMRLSGIPVPARRPRSREEAMMMRQQSGTRLPALRKLQDMGGKICRVI